MCGRNIGFVNAFGYRKGEFLYQAKKVMGDGLFLAFENYFTEGRGFPFINCGKLMTNSVFLWPVENGAILKAYSFEWMLFQTIRQFCLGRDYKPSLEDYLFRLLEVGTQESVLF